MSCQKHPYQHADGLIYADAESCAGCSLNHSEHCDGWRTERAKRPGRKRTASMKPKRKAGGAA